MDSTILFANRHGRKTSIFFNTALDKRGQQCYLMCKEPEPLFTQREQPSVKCGNFRTQNQRIIGLVEPEISGRHCVDVVQLDKPFFYASEPGIGKDEVSKPNTQEA